MQLTNSPGDNQFQKIRVALRDERIGRYMGVAEKDMALAFEYYVWNCALSEAFHTSLHFAEIVCRNAIQAALLDKVGDKWFEHATFRQLLDERYRNELDTAIADEKAQHGDKVTSDHIVSALTFGFWDHLATKRFDRILWSKGIRTYFPNAPETASLTQLHDLIEAVRRWRNRIAHHRAIFDKGPSGKHNSALSLVKWVCEDTGEWVKAASSVPAAMKLRPQPRQSTARASPPGEQSPASPASA